jgi:hypothetical protein
MTLKATNRPRQDDRRLSLTLFGLVFLKSRRFRLKNSPQRIARRSSRRIRPLRTLQSGGLKNSTQGSDTVFNKMSFDSPSHVVIHREVLVRKVAPLAMGKLVSARFNLTACVAPCSRLVGGSLTDTDRNEDNGAS